jgi:hypothetical protein
MPPSALLNYSTVVPANNKWAWNASSRRSLRNLPEYLIDVKHVYRFSYDQSVNEVEDQFAQGAAPGGDLTLDDQPRAFFGEVYAKGEGLVRQAPAVPASVPYLTGEVSFRVSREAVGDFLRVSSPYYPSSREELEALLRDFPPCSIRCSMRPRGARPWP